MVTCILHSFADNPLYDGGATHAAAEDSTYMDVNSHVWVIVKSDYLDVTEQVVEEPLEGFDDEFWFVDLLLHCHTPTRLRFPKKCKAYVSLSEWPARNLCVDIVSYDASDDCVSS